MTGWFERFLMWLLPYWEIIKQVDGRDVVYLRRFYIFNPENVHRWGKIYLHHILRSDDDLDPHDHPWNFTTIMLAGGYMDEGWEVREDYGREWSQRNSDRDEFVYPFKISRRAASHLHRVRLFKLFDWRSNAEQSAWTLVFCGRHIRDWGFMTKGGWVQWKKYLGITEDPNRV